MDTSRPPERQWLCPNMTETMLVYHSVRYALILASILPLGAALPHMTVLKYGG
jgi:hypothetical protein